MASARDNVFLTGLSLRTASLPTGRILNEQQLGERLAVGRTAEVYAWQPDRVLKLFHPWMPRAAVRLERDNARAAHSLGLAVAAPGDIVRVRGRAGLDFERIDGPSMMAGLNDESADVEGTAQRLADLHVALHAADGAGNFVHHEERLRRRVTGCGTLDARTRNRVLAALGQLPPGETICHGDFHPGNILLGSRGPVTIDWIDASRGNPLADVAQTVLLFRGRMDTGTAPAGARQAMRTFHDTYLDRYFGQALADRELLAPWFPVLAAARLTERIPEQRDWLLAVARGELADA